MKVTHNISLIVNDAQIQTLSLRDVPFEAIRPDLIIIRIEETHPAWSLILELFPDYERYDLPNTKFTTKELRDAQHLVLQPSWHFSYPQPKEGYKRATYDDADYCSTCGIGLKQRDAFRMLGEPKWGTRSILQLNWIMDEYFVHPEIWNKVFRPLGIDSRPVVHHRTGRQLETIVQLSVTKRATSLVSAEQFKVSQCSVCKRKKLSGVCLGRFPHVEIPSGQHMAKTIDYFGGEGGPAAWNEIIISSELYKAIFDHKLRGVEFTVVA